MNLKHTVERVFSMYLSSCCLIYALGHECACVNMLMKPKKTGFPPGLDGGGGAWHSLALIMKSRTGAKTK